MRIIKLSAKGRLEIKNVKDDLRVLQNEVGGYIEEIRMFEDEDIIVIADEDGKVKRRSSNAFIPGLYGDVIICGVKGEKFVSVPLIKLNRLIKLFGEKKV